MVTVGNVAAKMRTLVRMVGSPLLPDKLADRFVMTAGSASTTFGETILIAPPASGGSKSRGGNIGDQAMIEAFVDNVGGRVRIIVDDLQGSTLPARFGDRVVLEEMPKLIYGWGIEKLLAFRKLRGRLAGASHLAIIGADVMDGGYSQHSSVNRARVARMAAVNGVDTRVLGFSWKADPNPVARETLRVAAAAGAELMLRDPVSFERAGLDRLPGIVQVADMVFCARQRDAAAVEEFLGSTAGPYALVNVSGLVGQSIDQSAEYDDVIDVMIGAGLTVLLVPHVSRPEADDIQACAALFARHQDKAVRLVDRLLPPPQILELCAGASVIVTGRMHLSVMALANGVPAVTLSTHGKVEGLFQLFDFPAGCVEPLPGFGARVAEVVRQILTEPDIGARIIGALPAVRDLAALNFRGMPAPDAPVLVGPERSGNAST